MARVALVGIANMLARVGLVDIARRLARARVVGIAFELARAFSLGIAEQLARTPNCKTTALYLLSTPLLKIVKDLTWNYTEITDVILFLCILLKSSHWLKSPLLILKS